MIQTEKRDNKEKGIPTSLIQKIEYLAKGLEGLNITLLATHNSLQNMLLCTIPGR
jgi:hypothetical protein